MTIKHVFQNASGLLAFALIAVLCGQASLAGSIVAVGSDIPAAQRVPVERIDHSVWGSLLKKYVDLKGMVNYKDWKASSADQQALDSYLNQLSAAKFAKNSDHNSKLAFWINAYNAVTVKGILREYPTSSIRNHTARLFGYNIWKDLQLQVADESYSLEHMEHEILRKMGEPRIHFAIVCASIGCPRLLNEAYTADKLDGQLTGNAQVFFADRTKFQYDATEPSISVSPILEWFDEDFGSNQNEQMAQIAPFLPSVEAQRYAKGGAVRVRYLDYDWGINSQNKRR